MHDIRKFGALVTLVAWSTCASGCGTILMRADHDDVKSPLYLGTRFDGWFLALCLTTPFNDDMEDDWGFGLFPFVLIDLPLSLVADTLLLPVTIPEHFDGQRRALKELVAAIEDGDLAAAQALVAEDPELLRLDVGGEDRPLHLAVREDQPELVDWLASTAVERGEGEMLGDALRIAIEARNLALVRILLDRGAEPDGRDGSGWPLSVAVTCEDPAVVELLLDRGASLASHPGQDTPLHGAAFAGDAAMTELLVARGADVNASGWKGNTPLHVAALSGHIAVARLLVDRGADVGLRNEAGKTPLEVAGSRGHAEVAEFLRSRGGGR